MRFSSYLNTWHWWFIFYAWMHSLLYFLVKYYISPKSKIFSCNWICWWAHTWTFFQLFPCLDVNTLILLYAVCHILNSPEKIKVKPSPKKKNSKKAGRERDMYKKNYFHACESLLSLMVNKKCHRKTAVLSLKKSGPELPELLTQFSAGIAGTGLAVLFSVVTKLACRRVPFCTSRLFSTGVGFGLVWLSWAVNNLRDTIIYISKNSGKLGLKEEEMVRKVDKSVHEIYFRAAALMAVAVLKFAWASREEMKYNFMIWRNGLTGWLVTVIVNAIVSWMMIRQAQVHLACSKWNPTLTSVPPHHHSACSCKLMCH